MRKNLLICCDGTSKKLESSDTNVVRLFDALDRKDPHKRWSNSTGALQVRSGPGP